MGYPRAWCTATADAWTKPADPGTKAVLAALRVPRLWSEIPVAAELETPSGPAVIKGIIELLYIDNDNQLVIPGYKSDAVANDAEVRARMEHCQWQGAAHTAAGELAARQEG